MCIYVYSLAWSLTCDECQDTSKFGQGQWEMCHYIHCKNIWNIGETPAIFGFCWFYIILMSIWNQSCKMRDFSLILHTLLLFGGHPMVPGGSGSGRHFCDKSLNSEHRVFWTYWANVQYYIGFIGVFAQSFWGQFASWLLFCASHDPIWNWNYIVFWTIFINLTSKTSVAFRIGVAVCCLKCIFDLAKLSFSLEFLIFWKTHFDIFWQICFLLSMACEAIWMPLERNLQYHFGF